MGPDLELLANCLLVSEPYTIQPFPTTTTWSVCILPDYLRDKIVRVIFNDLATIIIWDDGTKTVTKCHPDDSYDKEKGLMACIIKYLTGNTGRWNEILKDWIDYEADERKRLSTSQWEEKEPKG